MQVANARRTGTQKRFNRFEYLRWRGAISLGKGISPLSNESPEFQKQMNQCCPKLTMQPTNMESINIAGYVFRTDRLDTFWPISSSVDTLLVPTTAASRSAQRKVHP